MKTVMISCIRMNPYVGLLAAGLEEVGVSCAFEDTLSPAVVARWLGKADVFHLHWAEALYRSWSSWRSARKLVALLVGLILARRAGIGLIYTAHNVRRHEDEGTLDRVADAAIYRLVDAVHVHDDEARRLLIARHRPRRVVVVAHGSYIGAYPNECSRETARERLGLAGEFVFLALGQIRPYKGLDDLIAAFGGLEGDALRLVIAGHPHDAAYGEHLRRLAEVDRRIRLDLRFVPPDHLQYYMNAADVCVMPYRSGTTSGAAILALSFGRPVIAPAIPPFLALLSGGSGLLYTPGVDHLREALAAARQMDLAQASTSAWALARSLDWRPIARQHLDVYTQLTGGDIPC